MKGQGVMRGKLIAPLVLLAGTALSGCVAVAIPVLAGGAMITAGKDADDEPQPVPAPSVAAMAAPAPRQTTTPKRAPPPPPGPAVVVQSAPVIRPEPTLVHTATPAPAPAASRPALGAPLATMQLTSFDPAFAQFAEASMAALVASNAGAMPMSALLKDPVALDGQRKACLPDQPAAAIIDLDPQGGRFAAPAITPQLPEHAAALAAMRDAGITIAWISDSPITATGAIRTALEQSGLDPRGQDVLVLTSNPDDRKQALRDALSANSCLIAIAGDERPDFDERFRYLKNPAAGAGLEVLIGNAWFLINNIFPSTTSTGPDNP